MTMIGTAPQPAPQLTTPISVCRPSFRLVSGPPLSPWWNLIMVVLVMTLTIMAIGVDSCHSATGQLKGLFTIFFSIVQISYFG